MESLKKILRTPTALVVLLAAIVAFCGGIGGAIIKSISDQRVAMLPLEYPLTVDAKLTALAPTSTNIPTPRPPFDVTVTIEGGSKQVEPIFPVKYPPLKEITIEVPLADRSIDQCDWSVTSDKGTVPSKPQGCMLTFVPPTDLRKVFVNVRISTSSGEITSRNLEFDAQ